MTSQNTQSISIKELERKSTCILSYKEWLQTIAKLLIREAKWKKKHAEEYAEDNDSWRVYYEEGYTPMQAIKEDFSYA